MFKALADATRRHLLDQLFTRDGRTLTELEQGLEMTRFGVMKHLKVLEEAGLVVTRRSGREKLHFLNAVPIQLIHERWIDKYDVLGAERLHALTDLKIALETTMTTQTDTATTTVLVNRIWIKADTATVWKAITSPEWNARYGYRAPRTSTSRPAARPHPPVRRDGRLRRCPRPADHRRRGARGRRRLPPRPHLAHPLGRGGACRGLHAADLRARGARRRASRS